MKKYIKYIMLAVFGVSIASCDDYLEVSSPANTDDIFVTSTTDETFKTLSWIYAEYRQNAVSGGNYNWNDCCTDAEYFPESAGANDRNGRLRVEELTANDKMTQFNSLFACVARSARVADIIENKSEYKSAKDANKTNEWTQLYGEAKTLYCYFYFELVRHFGDVPFEIENKAVSDGYELTSRFEILDEIIEDLIEVEPLMYKLGEGGITAERMSRTFANALIGEACRWAAGWQTIRTDVAGLYGDVQFEKKGTEAHGCVYARRTDYKKYYETADKYFTAAINTVNGTARLITNDERADANNPFQRHLQYQHDMQVSPESLFEVGNIAPNQSERPYSQGRPSNGGGSNAAPCKVFGGIRIIPSFYYTGYEDGDKRMDASMAVTGSDGAGNEAMLTFEIGTRLSGGIANNKWDENRVKVPYTTSQRNTGINYDILHMSDVYLMAAEAKAMIGKDAEALALVNAIRERAFGNSSHNLSGLTGDKLLDAIWNERKLELLGEGDLRGDMILSGKFVERANAVRQQMKEMMDGLEANGYYTFSNGRTISNYIWIKNVHLDKPLTKDADPTNPALFPGWRGIFDYANGKTSSDVKGKVKGTDHNIAIKGLFEKLSDAEIAALEADGYTKQNWGVTIVKNRSYFMEQMIGGVPTDGSAPRYYFPMPAETISQSKGKLTNGYGLSQE